MRARLTAICQATTGTLTVGRRTVDTAIDKRPVHAPVAVTATGLADDTQADTEHHGGPDQALYAYSQTDADHWIDALGRALPPGSFGENLRVAGVDASGALVGERWSIGAEVEVTVTAPRIPCRVFAGFLEVDDLVARFLSAGRPGAYLRVDRPGTVQAGDRIRVVHRPAASLSVAEVLRIHTADRHRAAELLALDDVAVRVRDWANEHLAATGTGGR